MQVRSQLQRWTTLKVPPKTPHPLSSLGFTVIVDVAGLDSLINVVGVGRHANENRIPLRCSDTFPGDADFTK